MERIALGRDRSVDDVIRRERSRLGNFIRRRVPDPGDAEEILQDVFAELWEANRRLMPIEHVSGWLFRVARNRIIDLFRKARPDSFADLGGFDDADPDADDDASLPLEDLLPSTEAGPEAAYARRQFLDALHQALLELPPAQREVFVAHELEGRSFKALAAETGVSINTLLSRKRYAVLNLREKLRDFYDDLEKG